MRILKFLFTIGFCSLISMLSAQRIDNTASFLDINSDKYFRFHYENDYFTATDKYYTQGVNLEFVHPCLQKNPLTKTLLRFKESPVKYGLSIEQNGYTPTSISHDDILYGDRPFAANLILKTFIVSTDTMHKKRLSAILSTGFIGPAAFGEEEQRGIHHALKNIEPHGWQHQIQNDIILNYALNYDKQLIHYKNYFLLNANAQINVGTLNDKATVGFTMMLGKMNNPFMNIDKTNKNFQFYVFSQSLVSAIAYDETLQGGLFNRSSPYTIPAQQMSRLTLQDNFGVVMMVRRIYLEYDQSILSKEFKTGKFHRWGGIKVGFSF